MKKYNKSNISLAQKLRREQTKWEKKLWYDFLNTYPIRFQRQKSVGDYIIDFYCAKAMVAVELDGYYHNTDGQYKEDLLRTKELNEQNITVIRFKNSEIDTEFEKVCKKIDFVVKLNLKKIEEGA